jgi:TPR repeat protein
VFFGLKGRKEVAAQATRFSNGWHATAGVVLGALGSFALVLLVGGRVVKHAFTSTSPKALSDLGDTYMHGKGVPKDPARAVALYEQACDGDDARGCSRLAYAYAHGRGAAVDEARAVALYRRSIALFTPSCDKGDAQDCDGLGIQFVKGNGVPKDEARALALFTKACDGSSASGCANLGIMYADGEGVPKDAARALALYTKACDGGDALGCSNLGMFYKHGEGVPKDEARALVLYTKACDGDYALGCANLGDMYVNGNGVPKDETRALALFTRACDGGSAPGCANLGIMYADGEGVPKDAARALALYNQACDAGSAFGCTLLGETSERTLPPDGPPFLAAKASEGPGIESKLLADPAYVAAWTHVDDRNLLLSAISQVLATERTDADTDTITKETYEGLKRRKLVPAFFAITTYIPRVGSLPADFAARSKTATEAASSEPHRGLWRPTTPGTAPIDLLALAYWLHPRDAGLLREFIATRRLAGGWQAVRHPVRPYLSRERAALERLALLTPLSPTETSRLHELRASKLGDDPPEVVDLAELLHEYGSNEVRADDRFKGHVIEFTGVAGGLERGTIGGINLAIGTGAAFEHPEARCYFNDSQTQNVKALNRGDRVRVRGRVNGLAFVVMVDDCELAN